MEIRRQLVRGGSFLPLWEGQGWKSDPQTWLQDPLHAESDVLPVYASTLQARACNSVFVEQANIWMDG